MCTFLSFIFSDDSYIQVCVCVEYTLRIVSHCPRHPSFVRPRMRKYVVFCKDYADAQTGFNVGLCSCLIKLHHAHWFEVLQCKGSDTDAGLAHSHLLCGMMTRLRVARGLATLRSRRQEPETTACRKALVLCSYGCAGTCIRGLFEVIRLRPWFWFLMNLFQVYGPFWARFEGTIRRGIASLVSSDWGGASLEVVRLMAIQKMFRYIETLQNNACQGHI